MHIVGTNTDKFKRWEARQGVSINNGSYWYAKELEEIILPKINLDIFIVTAGAKLYKAYEIPDGAVVVCHDNRDTQNSYGKLFGKDILWVCSKHSTVDTLRSYGEKAVYVPLSIDSKYVKKFKRKKTKDIAFVGNAWAFKESYLKSLPSDIVQLSGLQRNDLLKEMAKYKRVIAEGRCLMEAQALGSKCEVPKYENIEAVYVDLLDSRDAIPFWRNALQKQVKVLDDKTIIKCMIAFNDLAESKRRIIGEVFTVSKDRANELLSHKLNIVERLA